MSQTPLTISVDIADILKEMNGKLDRMQQETNTKLDRIEKDLAELKTEVKVLNEKVDGQGKRLDKLESTGNKQLWALIIMLGGAILTGIVATLRLFFTSKI